jgi:glycosyltransferase involved in cell wall biosynthesis
LKKKQIKEGFVHLSSIFHLLNLPTLLFHRVTARQANLQSSLYLYMNIAIDIRCLMDRELTGVGEYTNNLLKELFKLDNTNQYYLFYNSLRKVKVPFYDYENVHYIKFNWPNKLLNLSITLFGAPKIDKMIEKKVNHPNKSALSANDPHIRNINLFFFPNISFFSTDCPYMITCHDLSFEYFPEFLNWKRKLWHRIMSPRLKFENAKKIIAVSKNTARDLTDFSLPSLHSARDSSRNDRGIQKIKTIYSGIADNYKVLKKDNPKLKKIKQKYRLPEKFIFFLGTKEPRKNIDSLVRAFELFKKETGSDLRLIITGAKGWSNPTNYSLLSTLYIPYIPEQDKRYFLNLASMFIFPSHYEGFGFPVLEAMACGCPVITSNNSSLGEICEDAAILINSHDVNELKNAIINMTDPRVTDFYKQKGLLQAQKFSWKKTAEDVLTTVDKT